MSSLDNSVSLESLLEHAGWVRALARRLVSDESRADDVVQQTWLAAARQGEWRTVAGRAWLSRVVRNLSFQSHRDESRRRRRERLVARPERDASTPDVLLERAELQRQVVGLVLELRDPYRSTLLLRFFEELTPREISEREAVPIDTVRTRISRALEQLRERLDREHRGDRRAWLTALLPLAGLEALAPGGAAASSVSTAATAASVQAATSTGAGLTVGGIIMTQKFVLTLTLFGLTTLAVGLAIGTQVASMGREEARLRFDLVDRAEHEELAARYREARASLETAGSDRTGAQRRAAELESEVATLRRELNARRGAVAEEEKPAAVAASAMPVPYEKWAELRALLTCDWLQAGAAIDAVHEQIIADFERRQKNLPEEDTHVPDLQEKSREMVRAAWSQLAGLMRRIPTHAYASGELTHPIVLANLTAGALEDHGLPLDEDQKASIAALGEEFDAEFDRLQASYTDETPRIRRILDELELKRDYVRSVEEVLTGEQRRSVFHPGTRHRYHRDYLSPAMMLDGSLHERHITDLKRLVPELRKFIAGRYRLTDAQIEASTAAIETWTRDMEPALGRIDMHGRNTLPMIHIDDALTTGRAHQNLVEQLLHLPDLSSDSRERMLRAHNWLVVRVFEPARPR